MGALKNMMSKAERDEADTIKRPSSFLLDKPGEARELKRFAVLSDIHGNRWALEAVLEDIGKAGITQVLNLGDVLYGPLDPAGTADILADRAYPTVRGNEDRIITEEDQPISETLSFVRKELRGARIEWLRSLPPCFFAGAACLFHGMPGSDSTYLLWEVERSGARPRDAGHVSALLAEVESPLILCGHDHIPQTLILDDGRMVVNPGSVGLPAYSETHPHSHVMETGTPHARYSVILQTERGWSATVRAVEYDWRSAVRAAIRNSRPDWAKWLQTGRASL